MGEKMPREGDGILAITSLHTTLESFLNFSEQVNQSFPASNLIKVVTNWLICKQDE